MVSGTVWPFGDPFLERQDEPTLGVSTRNPLHLLAGANDYRTVDLNLPELDLGEGSLGTTSGRSGSTGEPWVGEYISTDGGARWQSTLLPGYPQDTSAQGMSSPLHGFTTAADPVIAAGTNGMFYYGGIAFNRGTSFGTVFVARFMDLNNKENGNIVDNSFPLRYINTTPVAYGTVSPSDFLDKPWVATDIPRSSNKCSFSVTQADGSIVQQTIPAGNVYVAYANVATSSTGVLTSTIYFSRSTNCGASWSSPIAISKGYAISQGATIQVDPETGIVYVAWRVIHNTPTANDAIAIAASLNGGQSFFPALTVVSLPPFNLNTPTAPAFFDQGTTIASFRTTAYPALAVGDSGIPLVPGPLYLAWSQRGVGPNGEARIMMLAVPGNAGITSSGFKPPTPFPVDNGEVTNDVGGTFSGLNAGHQVMPMMTFNQGHLLVVYYDLRQNHTIGDFAPSVSGGVFVPDPNGNFFEETREPVEEFPASGYTPYFIDDAGLTVRRNTMDLVLAQGNAGYTVPTFNYVRVTHYDFGLLEGEDSTTFRQLKFDPPNLPMFEQGQAAFMGDYVGITGPPFVLVKCGSSQCWTYNNPSPPGVAGTIFAAPKPAPSSAVNYATWTSNQDVIPPPNGQWDTYTAIATGPSVYSPSQNVPGCMNGFEGDRNQNVYMSRISQGLLVTSPQVSKPLSASIQRGFAILVQNATSGRSTPAGFVNYFRLTIANQPANGFASFAQFVPASPVPSPPFPARNNGISFPLTSIDVAIAAHTGVARTVFAVSSNPTASILLNVQEISALGGAVLPGGMSSFILLNADGTVPTGLVDPNGQSGGNSITDVELYNPSVTSPSVTSPSVTSPSVTSPSVTSPSVTSPSVTSPSVTSPSVTSPSVTSYDAANPSVTSSGVAAPSVTSAPLSDGTYAITNTGNTSASYNISITGGTTTPLQLLLSQIYMTPQTNGNCQLITQQQDITLANVPNVPIITPGSSLPNPSVTSAPVTEPTISLGPGDTAYITLRGNVDTATMQQILTQVTPVVVPQAINSNNTTATTPPATYPPISIVTALLPPTDPNDSGYSFQLQSAGGKPGTATWTILAGGLPTGITLSPSGLISGTAATPGSFPVMIQVVDTNSPPDTATQSYVFNVSATPLTTQFVMSAPDGVVGQTYAATPLTATGGTTPYTFNATGLPAGLSINPSTGLITGTPTTANPSGSPVGVNATDSALPAESVSYSTTIRIGEVIQISPSSATLPAGTIGLSYSYQLSASGGIGTLVFGAGGLPGGGTLSSTGLISFVNPQTSTVTFTVSVHDQANPNQTQTANYTINFAPLASGNLTFVTPPSSTPIGQVISPAVQVQATDNSQAVIPSLAITLSLSGPGTLSGTLTQMTNASGIATFPDLSINAAGTGDTLKATAGTVSATSTPFNITSTTPQACAPTPGAPLSWWPMNGNAMDIRGGKPGTLQGTGGQFVPAEVGQGFQSGGEGSVITVPAGQFLNPVNFTAAAWIKVNAISSDETMLVVWQGNGAGGNLTSPWTLGVVGNGAFSTSTGATQIGTPAPGKVFAILSDGTNELDIFSNTVLKTGVFYYVALTWNGPHVGATLYVNGNPENSGASSPMGFLSTPSNPFQIGGIENGLDSFNGVIDDLQIWGAGITQFQLATIYKAGAAGQCQAMWWTETALNTDNIGSIAPDGTGATEYTPPTPGNEPYNIIGGPDGNVWYTDSNLFSIDTFAVSLSPSATFSEYSVTPPITGTTRNQYNLLGITGGPDGNLWFTEGASPTTALYVGSVTPSGTITQYQVPTVNAAPQAIIAGPDGNLWFTEQGGGNTPAQVAQIAKMTTSGAITEYPTTTGGSGPQDITVGPDGNLWFTENLANKIGVISTSGTVLNEFPIPAGLASVTIASGGSGYLVNDVVTVLQTGGTGGTLKITGTSDGIVTGVKVLSRGTGFSVATGVSTSGGSGTGLTVNVDTLSNDANPWGITAGSDGNVWFTGLVANDIFQVTTDGLFTAFPLPANGGSPVYVREGPDGNLWYTDFVSNSIGRITPAGVITEFPIPTASTEPWGIGLGPAVTPVSAPPTSVTAILNAGGAPQITWTASTSSNVVGYNVYRSTNSAGPFTLVNSSFITGTSFTDLNAPGLGCPSTTYYYSVTAVGTDNAESPPSNQTNVAVPGAC